MIVIAFLLATTALILQGILLPKLTILAFAPFLALIILKCKLNHALWLAMFAGALVDLFADDPMGLHALNYVLLTASLYRLRRHLTFDNEMHVTLFTYLISCLSTTIQLALLFLFERKVPFELKGISADIFLMALLDAFYAFVWFAAPLRLIKTIHHLTIVFRLKHQS